MRTGVDFWGCFPWDENSNLWFVHIWRVMTYSAFHNLLKLLCQLGLHLRIVADALQGVAGFL